MIFISYIFQNVDDLNGENNKNTFRQIISQKLLWQITGYITWKLWTWIQSVTLLLIAPNFSSIILLCHGNNIFINVVETVFMNIEIHITQITF